MGGGELLIEMEDNEYCSGQWSVIFYHCPFCI